MMMMMMMRRRRRRRVGVRIMRIMRAMRVGLVLGGMVEVGGGGGLLLVEGGRRSFLRFVRGGCWMLLRM